MSNSVLARSNTAHVASQAASAEELLARLRLSGIEAAIDVLEHSVSEGLAPSSEPFFPVLVEMSTQLLMLFNRDALSNDGYAILGRLSPELAKATFGVMMQCVFPNATPDLATLNESGVIVFGGLLSAAGAHDNAVGFLGELSAQRAQPGLQHALLWVRARAISGS